MVFFPTHKSKKIYLYLTVFYSITSKIVIPKAIIWNIKIIFGNNNALE